MRVKLTPKASYEVTTEDGRSLGVFNAEKECWHGLMALRKDDGDLLIVAAPNGMAGMFGMASDVHAVSASPGLFDVVQEKELEGKDGTSD